MAQGFDFFAMQRLRLDAQKEGLSIKEYVARAKKQGFTLDGLLAVASRGTETAL